IFPLLASGERVRVGAAKIADVCVCHRPSSRLSPPEGRGGGKPAARYLALLGLPPLDSGHVLAMHEIEARRNNDERARDRPGIRKLAEYEITDGGMRDQAEIDEGRE